MALPLLPQNRYPGSPAAAPDTGQRELLAAAKRAHSVKRRAGEDGRRVARRNSLRRAKNSTEELRRTRARGASSGTVVDTSSAAGRSFTVGNINNGIIYLRPIVRSANQRTRPSPDPFVFPPTTPPDSGTIDENALRSINDGWRGSFSGSRTPEPPPLLARDVITDDETQQGHTRTQSKPIAHIRSRSFSTADEHSSQRTEPGTFKVVIERPSLRRPKTADTGSLPILQVPIPHYRLGTPRFSARGTAILRSSVYTRASGTEDIRSSVFSRVGVEYDRLFPSPPQRTRQSYLSRRHSDAYLPTPIPYRTTMDKAPLQSSTAPSSARASKVPIGPQLYDALTLNPDDQAVVRFSPSGDIVAATPSRLIAHITSPSFLDYELLSDFFLTFRSFLSPNDLVAYLIARLRWAVNRQDDFGRIVRVRTFVALRHWILNYFVDDFVPSFQLRVYFCNLVNSLYEDLRIREDGGGGDIKIIGELKKCWRRTCALYWDDAASVGKDLPDDDLLPGGRLGSRNSRNLAGIAIRPATPKQMSTSKHKPEILGQNPSDQFASRHMDWVKNPRHAPQHSLTSPHVSSQDHEGIPLSPASEQSMQVLSCSIPMRALHRVEPGSDLPLYPHPVPTHLATSPQYSMSISRPNRPSHGHKRSGSFSDALRDHRAPLPLPKNASQDAHLSSVLKIPGSLVRGAIYQPGSPYIDIKTVSTLHATKSHLEFEPVDTSGAYISMKPGYTASPGVKKLLGSVRRALSSKQGSIPQTHAIGLVEQFSLPSPARDSNPTTANSIATPGGVHKRRYARPRAQVRVDMLAAKVSESFKEAVKAELEQERNDPSSATGADGWDFELDKPDPQSPEDRLKVQDIARLNSNVTMGSRSIVIFDDTGAPALPLMSGALPVQDQDGLSVHDVSGGMIDPEQLSEYYGQDQQRVTTTRHSELYEDPNRTDVLGLQYHTSHNLPGRPSTVITQTKRSDSINRPTTNPNSTFRRQASNKSTRSGPTSLRRYGSYHSGLAKRQTGLSISATTTSDARTMSSDNDPFFLDRHPTRQLRRRPGGDLRAVDNVHDLEQSQRPHSTGTLSNRTHSIANSVIHTSGNVTAPTADSDDTVGAATVIAPDTETASKKPLSLVETHSSQPNLRPSFEAEVAKLAALPDDTDDDGGIESALMKLEGRYEKKSPESSPRSTIEPQTYQPTGAPGATQSSHLLPSFSEHGQSKSMESMSGKDPIRYQHLTESRNIDVHQVSKESLDARTAGPVSPKADSEDSFSSIPLLERGLSDMAPARRSKSDQRLMRASAKPAPLKPLSPKRLREQVTRQAVSPNSSMEYIVETDSMKRIPKGATMPRSPGPRESFLLDEDQNLSDMSDDDSVMVTKSDDTSQGVRSFFDDEPATMENENDILPHPMRHPPTPPLTADRFNKPIQQIDIVQFQKGLPTPGLTPTSKLTGQPFSHSVPPVEPPIELKDLKKDIPTQPPSHLPFILAYDSETLAQQLTIIEKDALDEIDWKELIELRWKQSSPQIRDWVEYLRTQEPHGVDVVIARFNLVVKWALSECVLTENVEERARCIVKYIHIASHARRLRNYATMYQITIALLSTDCARLKKTWELVPATEQQTMRDLEALVQPLRNFHNLRVEMETATLEEGCIPFIGIYTRDLIYNAQKPAFIGKAPIDGEHLVNFERHHTAATIVKSLLRLLEASSKYNFAPEPSILSKCLWMAALSDEEISTLSRRCE
ncbi:ras GEF [Glonium stellatum]|uniref:Ras GEF n=1 Tax=Glonium stellatum TaxID=574774 RepID=A0A8E2JPH5_9PEZI|nr:ras GEF [Glonium stellatum]